MKACPSIGSTVVCSREVAQGILEKLVKDGCGMHYLRLDAGDYADYYGLYYVSLTTDGVICETACTPEGEYKYTYAPAIYLVNVDDDSILSYLAGGKPVAIDLLNIPAGHKGKKKKKKKHTKPVKIEMTLRVVDKTYEPFD